MSDSSILPGGPTRTGKGVGFGKSVAFSAARGALLIGIAVIIGIVLLQVIDDGTTGPIGDGGSGASAGGVTTTTVPGASSTTSTTAGAPAKTPAEVSVLVLNGSGRPGAASTQTNALKAKGYQTGSPADAPQRTGNIVYYKSGLDRECTAVAAFVAGAPKVEPMPTPAPTGSENSACVVILGS